MGGSSQTIGYRYFLGVQIGLCIGPVDAVTKIRVGDRDAWTGNQTASGVIDVHAPTLFGGDEKEGGVSGSVEVRMGEVTQTQSSYLAGKVGAPMPADRGVLTLVMRGRTTAEATAVSSAIAQNGNSTAFGGATSQWRQWIRSAFYWSSMNPYIKNVEVTVRRITAGWTTPVWYAAKAQINEGMNAAHMVYQCLTDTTWGAGRSAALINTASFTTVADTLYAEGFGLSFAWSAQSSIDEFILEILRHVDGVLDTDLTTGQYTLKLIRNDYVPASLPVFDTTNIMSMDKKERTLWGETVNEIVVTYTNPETEQDATIAIQDLANIQSQGGIVSEPVSYPGVRSADIAYRLGERDLRARSTPLTAVSFTANRAAWSLRKGDAIKVTWPDYGLDQLILRVTNVSKGGDTDTSIKVEAVEDVFATPVLTYGGNQTTLWTDPAGAPAAVAVVRVDEVPYFTMAQILGDVSVQDLAPGSSYELILAERPAPQNSQFSVYDAATNVTANYSYLGAGSYASTCLLNGAAAWNATVVTIDTIVGDDPSFFVGGYALWDNEWVGVVSVAGATVTLLRGVFDTIPAAHADNSKLWFYSGDHGFQLLTDDAVRGETRWYREVGRSPSGESALASAPAQSLVHDGRWERPYPPADVKINGAYFPSTIATNFTITWSGRNKEQQTTDLVGWTDAHIDPPQGVTYTLEVYDNDTSALLATVANLTTTAAGGTYTYGGPGAANLRIEFYSKQGTLKSAQKFVHVAGITGYGFSYDNNYGGGSLGVVVSRGSVAAPASAFIPTPYPVWINGAYYSLSTEACYRSTDGGLTWDVDGPSTPYIPPFECTFVYGNGYFAATNFTTNYWKRREGGAWTKTDMSTASGVAISGGRINSITFDGAQFVMVCAEGRDIFVSTNLDNWTRKGTASVVNNLWNELAATKILKVGANYVAVGGFTTGSWPSYTTVYRIAQSTDLVTWTSSAATIDIMGAPYGAYFAGKYWAIASPGTTETNVPVLYSSTDFLTWTQVSTALSLPPGLHSPKIHVSASQMCILFSYKTQLGAYELRTANGSSWTLARPAFDVATLGSKADNTTSDAGGPSFLIRVGQPKEFGGKLLAVSYLADSSPVLKWPGTSPETIYFGKNDENFYSSGAVPSFEKSGLKQRYAAYGLPIPRLVSSGKRYAEFTIVGFARSFPQQGWPTFQMRLSPYNGSADGLYLYGNSAVDFGPVLNDVIGVLIDFTAATAEFKINNVSLRTLTGIDTTLPWKLWVDSGLDSAQFSANIGQSSFIYTQAGYAAWGG
jgi:hypothetical protein